MSVQESLLKQLISEPLDFNSVISDNTISSKTNLKVVHICWTDTGGAGIAAYRLHKGLCSIGVDSTMLVLFKKSVDPTVKIIPVEYSGIIPAESNNLQKSVQLINQNFGRWQILLSKYPNTPPEADLFSDAMSDVSLHFIKDILDADIINLHWVAGVINYQDLPRALGEKPVIWTLHDQNPFTGGCHYSRDCIKFIDNCGKCPNLGSHQDRDISWHIHRQKELSVKRLPITVVTPSKWLGDISSKSSIFKKFPHKVIPNGLPTEIFKPTDKLIARKSLNISADSTVILFGAASPKIHRKGLSYLLEALNKIDKSGNKNNISLAVYGEFNEKLPLPDSMKVYYLGSIDNEDTLSKVYSAVNAFVIPTLEDNLPNTILESLSCGCPVIGFKTGGVPDLVQHKKNGYLVEQKDVDGLVNAIDWIASLGDSFDIISNNCRNFAVKNFDYKIQANNYLEIYNEVIDNKITGEKLVKDGESAVETGDLEKALTLFESALTNFPALSRAYNNIGALQWHSNDVINSADSFANAVAIKPDNKIALLNLGDLVETVDDAKRFQHFAKYYLDCNLNDRDIIDLQIKINESQIDAIIRNSQISEINSLNRQPEVSVIMIIQDNHKIDSVIETLSDLSLQNEPVEVLVIDRNNVFDENFIPNELLSQMNVIICKCKDIENADLYNVGVRLANTDYCFSIMSGDRLKSGALNKLKELIINNPNTKVVFGDTNLTDVEHERFDSFVPSSKFNGIINWKDATSGNLLLSQSVGLHPLWKKNIHKKVGYFDSRYQVGFDQDFWIKVSINYNILHIDEPMSLIVFDMNRILPNLEQFEFIRQKYSPFITAKEPDPNDLFGGIMAASAFIADLANFIEKGQNQSAIELYDSRRKDFSSSQELLKVDRLMAEVRQRTIIKK